MEPDLTEPPNPGLQPPVVAESPLTEPPHTEQTPVEAESAQTEPAQVVAEPQTELPNMGDLRALASDLDDIDATLVRLDASEEPDRDDPTPGPPVMAPSASAEPAED